MSVETFPPSSAPNKNRDSSADDKDFSRLTGSLIDDDADKSEAPKASDQLDPNEYKSAGGSFTDEELDTSAKGSFTDAEMTGFNSSEDQKDWQTRNSSLMDALNEPHVPAHTPDVPYSVNGYNLDQETDPGITGTFTVPEVENETWKKRNDSVLGALNEEYVPTRTTPEIPYTVKGYTLGQETDQPIAGSITSQDIYDVDLAPVSGSLDPEEAKNYNSNYGKITQEDIDNIDSAQAADNVDPDAYASVDGSFTPEEIIEHNEQSISGSIEPEEIKGHEETHKGNRIKGALGAIARKLSDYLGVVPAEDVPRTLNGNHLDPQESQGEKQPVHALLDIKDRLLAAKDKVMGFAYLGALYATSGLASLGEAATKAANGANNFRSEYFTDPAPTEDDPDHRELNALGRRAILGVGILATATALYLTGSILNAERAQQATEVANQMNGTGLGGTDPTQTTVNGPSAGSIFPDNAEPSQAHLPIIEDAPSGQTSGVETTTGDLNVNFSPDIGHLEAGDTIWDDSMKSLTEGGFNGSPDELTERTNILTEWRLEKMGISAEQAKFLPVGTELPTPNFAELQELIAKAEQLKQ